ncbi:NAD(P)/FAD-dependent oxidoreductase [Thiomicrorhabdus sp.]|uniref:NAD(P)/FAD-dependent oxidoreductase n=1 Tax=Thiomicrorhabdus sp. TaxID=2039724 RepID=UPI0029C7E737|nr:NAD(P)/FAD-dependent oxidoreductase [Thiomicrorhabdus sp.]
MKKIVIVGGGAGGLELATRLGQKLGKYGLAEVTLIDRNRTHLWKPLLHEVVSGSLDTGLEAISYRAHSSENHYYFRMGSLCGLDKEKRQLILAPLEDHHGKQILQQRFIDYDYLVLAIGASSNDFGNASVHEHCYRLDSAQEAEDFHLTFLNRFMQYSEENCLNMDPETPCENTSEDLSDTVTISIVGAGATGVELAAELYQAVDQLERFGIREIHHSSLEVNLIEAADRILPALSESVSGKAAQTLGEQGVKILCNTMVLEVHANSLQTSSGEIHSDLIVWAAGIKAAEFLSRLGLQTNRIHQIEIEATLLAKGEERIFAIGDCCSFTPEGAQRPVPPTAQAAHQMAKLCADNLIAIVKRKPLQTFEYYDHGTLVSLGPFKTLGQLLNQMIKRKWQVEGKLAYWLYASLYRQHQLALYGGRKFFWIWLSSLLEKRIKPKLKLY